MDKPTISSAWTADERLVLIQYLTREIYTQTPPRETLRVVGYVYLLTVAPAKILEALRAEIDQYIQTLTGGIS